jgi:hypothetical protein
MTATKTMCEKCKSPIRLVRPEALLQLFLDFPVHVRRSTCSDTDDRRYMAHVCVALNSIFISFPFHTLRFAYVVDAPDEYVSRRVW